MGHMSAERRINAIGQVREITRDLPRRSPRFHRSRIGAMAAYDTLYSDPTATAVDLITAKRRLIRSGYPEATLAPAETLDLDQTIPDAKPQKS